MIKPFVDAFMANKPVLRAEFAKGHPGSYADVVRAVVSVLGEDEQHREPDPKRIHGIDVSEDYQGTLFYIITEKGYQPSTYWYVKVEYGSCRANDALEAIRYDSDGGPPTEKEIDEYMTLALHIVQRLKLMGDDE